MPGIIRSYVISKYKVEELLISKDFIENTDECFVTNSLMGIMPVRALEKKIFSKTKETSSIMRDYECFYKLL